jgi:hypothetical protein
MPGPKIAIATSKAPSELDARERLLIEALSQAGTAATSAIWSSPEVPWSHFSAVVIRSCWDYHLRVEEFLRWIKSLEDRNIPVINHPNLVRWNADKTYLKQLAACGIAIPETVWLQPGERANVGAICGARGWEDAVVKPVISASAFGTEQLRPGRGTTHDSAIPSRHCKPWRVVSNVFRWPVQSRNLQASPPLGFSRAEGLRRERRARDSVLKSCKLRRIRLAPAPPVRNLRARRSGGAGLANLPDGDGSHRTRTISELRSRLRPAPGAIDLEGLKCAVPVVAGGPQLGGIWPLPTRIAPGDLAEYARNYVEAYRDDVVS